MTIYLLDVNVLLALSDPMHVHHEAAHLGLAADKGGKLATFDQRISTSAVHGGAAALTLIAP